MVILTVVILGLKYCYRGNLPRYIISDKDVLSRWILRPNVIKLFTAVIYCHSMVFTVIIMFYNTESRYGHGMAVNYRGKKFYNIGPRCLYCWYSNSCLHFLKHALPLQYIWTRNPYCKLPLKPWYVLLEQL